jgi:hypothetical protein
MEDREWKMENIRDWVVPPQSVAGASRAGWACGRGVGETEPKGWLERKACGQAD